MSLLPEEKFFWIWLTVFGAALYFVIDALGKKKALVAWVLMVLACIGMAATYTLNRDIRKDAPMALLVLTLAVLGYDIYITRTMRIAKPDEAKPSAYVSAETRQIVSSAFHKLSSHWALHLVLYRLLLQPETLLSGLANRLEQDGICGARETFIDPVINTAALVRRLSDDKVSIVDDATRQVLREMFEAEPLLPTLK